MRPCGPRRPGFAPVQLHARVGDGSSSLRNVRVFAIRTDVLASLEAAFMAGEHKTTSAQAQVITELTPGVPTGSARIYVASVHIYGGCVGQTHADRQVTFALDGIAQPPITHYVDSCAYEASGTVGLLPPATQRLEIAVASGNGIEVTATEAVIAVLGLP